MNKMRNKGVTIMELVIVITLTGILGGAFGVMMVPTLNAFFYFPESSRINAAAGDVMDIIIEGDHQAKGLRFAGLPCAPAPWVTATAYTVGDYVKQSGLNYYCLINHTSGVFATDLAATRWDNPSAWLTGTNYVVGNYVSQGAYNYTCVSNHVAAAAFATDLAASRWIQSNISAASATSVTYNYANADNCGGAVGAKNNNSVTLTYDGVNHIVTRSINGGATNPIPYYVKAASGIKIDAPAGINFFRYYNAASTGDGNGELGGTYTAAARVDVSLVASSGSGNVKHDSGRIQLKSGVEIKRYTT